MIFEFSESQPTQPNQSISNTWADKFITKIDEKNKEYRNNCIREEPEYYVDKSTSRYTYNHKSKLKDEGKKKSLAESKEIVPVKKNIYENSKVVNKKKEKYEKEENYKILVS